MPEKPKQQVVVRTGWVMCSNQKPPDPRRDSEGSSLAVATHNAVRIGGELPPLWPLATGMAVDSWSYVCLHNMQSRERGLEASHGQRSAAARAQCPSWLPEGQVLGQRRTREFRKSPSDNAVHLL